MNILTVHRSFGRTFHPWSGALAAALFGLGSLGVATGSATGQLVHEGQTFTVIDASQVPTEMSESFDHASLPAPSDYQSDSMEFAGADFANAGSCSHCGPSGGSGFAGRSGFAGGYGMAGGSGACPTCDSFWYATIEGLYLRRFGDRRTTLSRDFTLDEFEYEWAPRITLGTVPDCVHGFEVGFTGVFEWDMSEGRVSNTNSLETLLNPVVTSVDPTIVNSFNGAERQSLHYDADFWSVEANRVFNGWGVSKVLYGMRYVDYEENFRYASLHPTLARGLLRSDTRNQLIGGQVGLDLLYPVGRHAYADFRGRAGAYLNVAESRVTLINDGARVLATNPQDESLAGLFEIGSGLRYALGESLSIRGGVEAWYMAGIASARDQLRTRVTRQYGRKLRHDDDIFVFGLTVGAEFKF